MQAPGWPTPAIFFDGQSAARHEVSVSVYQRTPAYIEIEGATPGSRIRWPLDRLRALSDQADTSSLVVTQLADTNDETPRDPARLVISDPILREWIIGSRPDLFRRDLKVGTMGRVLKRVALAMAAFAFILLFLLPKLADTLAVLIPIEREVQLGEATIRQMEFFFGGSEDTLRCVDPKAQAIFDRLGAQFAKGTTVEDYLKIIVLDHPMVNAFAAPGGHVVFFRGMIDEVQTPDELTAVLAHEIGHLDARDPTRTALRSAGSIGVLGLVLGDFAGGGFVLLLAEQLLDASYSREAETAADEFAFAALREAQIDASALGDLFERLREKHGDIEGVASHFVSHPSLSERIAAARVAGAELEAANVSMTDAEFATIKSACAPPATASE